jgi:hypothetical protein
MPGSAGFSIARVSMFDAARGATPVFEAVNLRIDSTVELDVTDALLDMRVTGSLDSVRAEDLTIADTNLGVAVRSIDIAAMEAYFTAMRSLAVSATALDPGAALTDLSPLVERGLAAGPSLTLEPIRLRVDDEPFDGRLVIAVYEDALKFVKREVKRGNTYNGIIMDPPPYGRGPDGERWTLEEKLDELIGMSASLLKAENRFFILNMYAVGLSSTVGKNIIKSHFNRTPEVGEFFLKSKTGNDLPMGTFARFTS